MFPERLLRVGAFSLLFSVALGIMLSPENLVILGQQSGGAGATVFPGLALAAAIHLFTAGTYNRDSDFFAASGGGTHLPKIFRPPLAVALSLASRGGFALWGTTAVLITAGYVFNETFMPAYPNLGFSFTLLALLMVLNLLGSRWAGVFQVVFVGAALAGLVALVVLGLLGSPPNLQPSPAGDLTWKQGLSPIPLLFLPFIGYELSSFLKEKIPGYALSPAAPMLAGIMAAFCLFFLWCFISRNYVPGLKLQESTVPYAYVARAVAGERGTQLMGIVLLAGSLATANALLLAVPLMASGLPPAGLWPLILRGRVFNLLLLVGAVALVMALGLGGSPSLPSFLKASVLLWLLAYAWHNLAIWREKGRGAAIANLCALALVAAVVLALITDSERVVLGIYMLLVVGALALFGSIPYGEGNLH
jgi:amino acid transporter